MHGFEPFHTSSRDVDGWKVTLSVWRNTLNRSADGDVYMAIVATGWEEAGQNLAVMDCDFVFSEGEDVVAGINESMQRDKVFEYLLSEAQTNLRKLQVRKLGGRILPS